MSKRIVRRPKSTSTIPSTKPYSRKRRKPIKFTKAERILWEQTAAERLPKKPYTQTGHPKKVKRGDIFILTKCKHSWNNGKQVKITRTNYMKEQFGPGTYLAQEVGGKEEFIVDAKNLK